VASAGENFAWQDRLTDLRPPVDIEGEHDYLTEIHPQAEAFVVSLAERLLAGKAGAAFFLDYGFPETEYFHPQRHMGTVMCHQLHQADPDPLVAVGQKDITAHVNFTGVALAAQNAGLNVLGYTSQAWFLLNLGLAELMANASLAERSQAQRLISEHEMGELFKVVGFSTSADGAALGFAQGDRSHRL
jgi:SAM-dependent MidA family methyltransferase